MSAGSATTDRFAEDLRELWRAYLRLEGMIAAGGKASASGNVSGSRERPIPIRADVVDRQADARSAVRYLLVRTHRFLEGNLTHKVKLWELGLADQGDQQPARCPHCRRQEGTLLASREEGDHWIVRCSNPICRDEHGQTPSWSDYFRWRVLADEVGRQLVQTDEAGAED